MTNPKAELCADARRETFDDATVEIVNRTVRRRVDLGVYVCRNCDRTALIPTEIMDNPDRKLEFAPALARAGFCGSAIQVAPFNEGTAPSQD